MRKPNKKISALTILIISSVGLTMTAFADTINQSPSTATQCKRITTGNSSPEGFTPIGQAQRELCHKGLYQGPIDGINGPLTHQALSQYQLDRHFQVTGGLNQQTALALGLMTGRPGIDA